ncbi:MAG: 3-deoxy-D-manno-octulosonate 8-phosphate phosphatase [Bacteroidia bacterium]|nr:MAG: 3-deoxy-D-manno-octulosonate 8-phosphate phosphatase [Bacteroidia bacterium]
MVRNFKERLREVKAFAFDVDGVCTNNQVIMTEEGHMLRKVNTRDGLAMSLAVQAGYPMAIITGGSSQGVAERFRRLGVSDIYLGTLRKLEALEEFCMVHELQPADVLYMGDDMPDLPVLQAVGFPTCPADAAPEIKEACIYTSPIRGGHGCVRDVVEQVLKVAGRWESQDFMNQ